MSVSAAWFVKSSLWFVILQGNTFAVTLYDAVYLYLKLAGEILNEPGKDTSYIKSGSFMYDRAKNYRTRSSEQLSFYHDC